MSSPAKPTAFVAVPAFGGTVVSLVHTAVIPLVPLLPGLPGSSPADTAWAITATLLAAAVATPTVGRLGDMHGKRRMLLVSLALLVAGSVVGALSDELAPLIAARALQGLARLQGRGPGLDQRRDRGPVRHGGGGPGGVGPVGAARPRAAGGPARH
ncbi:MFS transporter, partial [Actinosynnema sp. NPDC059797]